MANWRWHEGTSQVEGATRPGSGLVKFSAKRQKKESRYILSSNRKIKIMKYLYI